MTVEVRLAHADDAGAIGSVFARAFSGDPVASWITPDADRRRRLLARLNTAIARYEGIPRGATYVADDGGRIIGAAIWQPPKPRAVTWRGVPFALSAGAALGQGIPRMTRAGRAAARARPRERHWYLQLLGIDPDAQGRGIGSDIVRTHLTVLDREGSMAYLETTAENLPFYSRLGFAVTGEVHIHPGAPGEYSLLRSRR